MKPIENIRCHSGGVHVGLRMFIGTVLEMSSVGAIRHQHVEMRDEGHIGERLSCSARPIQMRRSTLRAFFKFSIQTSIAYT